MMPKANMTVIHFQVIVHIHMLNKYVKITLTVAQIMI